MAPKNKKRNAYFFFMKEMQEAEERKGRRITMATMSNFAHPVWAQLSLVEREPYEEMARMYKNDPNLRGGKLASDGTRVEDNLKEEQEKERLENAMKQSVKTHVNNIGYDSEAEFIEYVSKKEFYFISFNIMCRPNDTFMPNEVGLMEYSIRDGIMKEYHAIIHPGRIPTGYTGEAKRLCEEKHGIDIFGADIAERDLRKVYEKIKSFINPNGHDEYEPLFTLEDQLEQTKGCLEFLAMHARDPEELEVWNSVYLLLELRAGAGHPLPSSIIASDLLSKTCFQHHVGSRCKFHEDNDISYCALSDAKQLCFLISDATCLLFDVDPTERHMPARAAEEKEYMIKMPQIEVMTPRAPTVNSSQNVQRTWKVAKPAPPPRVVTLPHATAVKGPAAPRQPAGRCMATQFARLNLNMTPATVPGQGIGRGQRRVD